MSTTKYSALAACCTIIFALGLLPTLVNSYDCNALVNTKKCDPGLPGPQSSYPDCLVKQFGASAFIECASQKGAPKFGASDSDGDPTTVSALDVLIEVLSRPACDGCPLAQNIRNVAKNTAPSPNFVNFGANLCHQINPSDAGMCCLKKQCLVGRPEHSIQAFCAGDVNDLMNAPLLSNSCVSNAVATDDGSGNNDSSGGSGSGGDSSSSGDSSSDDEDPSTAEPSSSSTTSTPTTSSPSSDPAQVSTSATSPPVANSATTTSATSTSPTLQATPNTGAASIRQATFVDLLKRVGVGILPILAAF